MRTVMYCNVERTSAAQIYSDWPRVNVDQSMLRFAGTGAAAAETLGWVKPAHVILVFEF